MSYRRAALPSIICLVSVASGQSVTSTRSGLVYFFEGNVFIGDDPLQQKFGRFPEIGAGRVLRTEAGRAEVLLTQGFCLRIDQNSAIRLLSDNLSNTRVELLRGSAILEASHEAVDPPDTLIYKSWQVRVPQDSVARVDSDPPQIRVYSGTAEVSTAANSSPVAVRRGEVLPFAPALLAEPATTPAADDFNVWSMNRSSVVAEDNIIGAGITDDPDQADTSGLAVGSFSYFPQTGIPSLGIAYPYGISFWSPSPSFISPYLAVYPYSVVYPRLPSGALFAPRPTGISILGGSVARPGTYLPRPSTPLPPRVPAIAAPHVAAPRVATPRR